MVGMLGSTQKHDESERARSWSPPLPTFPPRCYQWFLHHIPARKDHDGKLQLTPSLPLVMSECQVQNLLRSCRLVLAL